MQGKQRIVFGGVAAAGALALALGAGSPALATVGPSFGNLAVTGPASATLPKYYNGTVGLTARFDGPVGSGISYTASQLGARLIAKNTAISASYVRSAPGVYASGGSRTMSPASAKGLYVEPYGGAVSAWTTPGKYRVTVVVTQTRDGQKKSLSGVKDVALNANVAYSKELTKTSGTRRAGQPFAVTVKAPYYQVGAKVTAYVKLKGKSSYVKTTSGYLKPGTRARSKAVVKIPAKYSKAGARYYFKVSAAPYAGGYKSVVRTM